MKNRIKLMKKYFKKKNAHDNHKAFEFITADTNKAILRAKEIISFETEEYSEPITIVTPNTNEDNKVRFRVIHSEETTRVDYDSAVFTTIFFGARTLFIHKTTMDFIDGFIEEDVSKELAYEDIVCVGTFLGYDDPQDPLLSILNLSLNLVNGTSIDIPLRKHYLFNDNELAEILTEKEQYIVQTIKKSIRSMK